MSRRAKEEHERYYTVSDPRSHPKGYTEYKVTAKFISKVNPEDVKEITVWKRYSDFKKLHGDLAYTHRNLFRRLEDFPSFPKAQVFGRFEPEVIEERRKAAEAMLRFTVPIPALNNSPQLKEFFRGGEVRRPLENCAPPPLPPPLIPVLLEGVEPGEEALESVTEPSLLDPEPREDPPRAVQDASEEHGPEFKGTERGPGVDDCVTGALSLPTKCEDEALDALFAISGEEEEKEARLPSCCSLSVQELALFDPFSKEASGAASLCHGDELCGLASSLADGPVPSPSSSGGLQPAQQGPAASEPGSYLHLATQRITQALENEAAGDYMEAFQGYRSGVDLLLQGMQGDPDVTRREAVKKKTAEYLQRAEEIVQLHLRHVQL